MDADIWQKDGEDWIRFHLKKLVNIHSFKMTGPQRTVDQ